jgi:transposase
MVITGQSVGDVGSWVEMQPDQRYRPICSSCGENLGRIHRQEKRPLRDLNMGEHGVWLGCQYRKAFCPHCEHIRVEDLEFFEPYERVTRRLQAHLHDLCGLGLSVLQVADRFGLNWKTVKRADQKSLERKYGQPDYDGLRLLAVDEIAERKGHHYLTVVLDYETGRVVWVGRERTAEALGAFFAELSEAQRAALQAVAMDMHQPYIKAVQEAVPHVAIVFDLFHVVAGFNQVIDQVRLSEYRKASRKDKEVFKGSKYLLLKHPKKIRKRKDRDHLQQLLALNHVIFVMLLLRDLLKTIWAYRSRAWAQRRLTEWCALARTVSHPEVAKFAKSLERHAQGILNHSRFPIHTSLLEGVNNKIKVIKRIAFGFHDLRYFSLKIFQAFDPNNRAPTPIPAN